MGNSSGRQAEGNEGHDAPEGKPERQEKAESGGMLSILVGQRDRYKAKCVMLVEKAYGLLLILHVCQLTCNLTVLQIGDEPDKLVHSALTTAFFESMWLC